MKQTLLQILRAALALCVVLTSVTACNSLRRLERNDPSARLALPSESKQNRDARRRAEEMALARQREIDSVVRRAYDGSPVVMMKDLDQEGNVIASYDIPEVTILGASLQNVVERNGKILIDFVVYVPDSLLKSDWQLVLNPCLQRGNDGAVDYLDPLVYTGDRYRRMQEWEYNDYYTTLGFQYSDLRRYVLSTDNYVSRHVSYLRDTTDRFDHLNDYLTPRYTYQGVNVLPGGDYYTRLEGDYRDRADVRRENYLRQMRTERRRVAREVQRSEPTTTRHMAADRLLWTNRNYDEVSAKLHHTDTATIARHRNEARYYGITPPTDERDFAYRFADPYYLHVKHPLYPNARLDTIIRNIAPDTLRLRRYGTGIDKPADSIVLVPRVAYYYTQEVVADEDSEKLLLYLKGGVQNTTGGHYTLRRSDTLTFSVKSMLTFLDERTRYMQVKVYRDKEDNQRFFFTFPSGKSKLSDTEENRQQIRAVRNLTRNLVMDPIYIIDSITLRATASPEGHWQLNERLSRERAEALRRVLVTEFTQLQDSLEREHERFYVTLDDQGREVVREHTGMKLPDLPNLLRARSEAEDWNQLYRLVAADTLLGTNEELLAMVANRSLQPDAREAQMRHRFPEAYKYMREYLYPQMRAVDFKFNLHRRGQEEVVVTTEVVDTAYMRALTLMKQRKYKEALEILRPYEDHNTGIAYMSAGLDVAAYRTFSLQPGVEDNSQEQYMMSILAARQGDEQRAIRHFKRAKELDPALKWRGNLDPELSVLIKKHGLDREDFQDL